jgi:hypothetical protein
MSKLNTDVTASNSPNERANVKVETGELSMEELGKVAAGSLAQDSSQPGLATDPQKLNKGPSIGRAN